MTQVEARAALGGAGLGVRSQAALIHVIVRHDHKLFATVDLRG